MLCILGIATYKAGPKPARRNKGHLTSEGTSTIRKAISSQFVGYFAKLN
jgi:hypothetical protein